MLYCSPFDTHFLFKLQNIMRLREGIATARYQKACALCFEDERDDLCFEDERDWI
jgi:hypothetical protein